MKDQDVNGIQLVDEPFVQKLKIKLREMRGYYLDLQSELYVYFPLSHHRPLSKKTIGHFKRRYHTWYHPNLSACIMCSTSLLSGQVLMQNATEQIFKLDMKHVPQLLPGYLGVYCSNTVSGILVQTTCKHVSEDEQQEKIHEKF